MGPSIITGANRKTVVLTLSIRMKYDGKENCRQKGKLALAKKDSDFC